MKKTCTTFVLIFFVYCLIAQTKKEVLFIGNSYTYSNNLPQLISNIATSKGDTLVFDSNTPGGYTFQQHSTDPVTRSKISLKNWDYVVLQEQSQRPSFPPEQVQLLVYPYADTLNRLIKNNDSCTITMFFMTWGRKNGDAEYCPVYPPVCTYYGMQSRLRHSYLEMGQMFNANVAPVGMVWKKIRESNPEIELYESDESHPSLAGSYLAACTFYASIFHKSPVGGYVPPGLNLSYAQIIQNFSKQIVFDSLNIWNIDTTTVNAGFTYTALPNGIVQFINKSRNATSYLWNFGDGNTSTEKDPVHTYQYCGTTYLVRLNAFNKCKSDTYLKEIMVPCYGINEISDNSGLNIFPNPANNQININFNSFLESDDYVFLLYDGQGKQIMVCNNEKTIQTISLPVLPNGLYFIKIDIGGKVINQKLIIQQDH
jgi:hypothetical protein